MIDPKTTIDAAQSGLDALRWTGLVEPMVLTLRLEGSGMRVFWCKTVARESHPNPGNATKKMPPTNMSDEKAAEWRKRHKSAYSHPVDIKVWKQSDIRIVSPLSKSTTQKDVLEFAKQVSDALFGDEIVEVEVARYINGSTIGVTAYELPAGKKIRNGDDDANSYDLSEIVILRNGRTCWEEYPKAGTVDVQPDFEGKLGYIVDEDERDRLRDLEI